MQRTTRRSTMQGQSKTEENDPVKKSTSNPVKSRKAAVESSPVETIFEEAMDPEIEISPEKPETSTLDNQITVLTRSVYISKNSTQHGLI